MAAPVKIAVDTDMLASIADLAENEYDEVLGELTKMETLKDDIHNVWVTESGEDEKYFNDHYDRCLTALHNDLESLAVFTQTLAATVDLYNKMQEEIDELFARPFWNVSRTSSRA